MTTSVHPYTPLRKERGLKSCVAEGWKLLAFHFRSFMRPLCFPLLLAGVGGAFFVSVLLQVCLNFLLPARVYLSAGLDAEVVRTFFMPDVLSLSLLLVAGLAMFFGFSVARGAIFVQIKHYAANDALPQAVWFLPAVALRRASKQVFLISAMFWLVALLLGGIVVWISVKYSWWWLMLLLPIFAIRSVYAAIAEQFCLVRGFSVWRAIGASLGSEGAFSGYFSLMVLMFAPLSFLCIAAFLPSVVLLFADFTNEMGVLLGDVSGIPTYLNVLLPLLTTIGVFVSLIGTAVRTWVLAFHTARY